MDFDDLSWLCGKEADFDMDGKVSFLEYLMETEMNERIFGKHDDDDDIPSFDFSPAAFSNSFTDDGSDDDFNSFDDSLDDDFDSFDGSFSYGLNDSFDEEGETSAEEIEASDKDREPEDYYDYKRRMQPVLAEAVYNQFPAVPENFTKQEVDDDLLRVLREVYYFDKAMGLKMLVWIVENFREAVCKGAFDTASIIGSMFYRDEKTDDDVILKYIYEHPEFEKIVLGEQFDSSITGISWATDEYCYYLCKKHDVDRIITVYSLVCNNPNIDKSKYPKEKLIDSIIFEFNIKGVRYADKKLYDFFKEEIESVGKPIIVNNLMEKLNGEENGRPFFNKNVDGTLRCIYADDGNEIAPVNSANNKESDDKKAEAAKSAADEKNGDFEDDGGSEAERDIPLSLAVKISDLENRLKEAERRIMFLMNMLGVAEVDSAPSFIYKAPQPTTTPQNENDIFVTNTPVAGSKYSDKDTVQSVKEGDIVTFLPEPENTYDKNAVLVLDKEGRKLGYLPKRVNKKLLKDAVYGTVSRALGEQLFIAIDVWKKANS